MVVTKRDGRKVKFAPDKIYNAVIKAFEETDGEISPYAVSKAKEISRHIESLEAEAMSVEEIQDIVEAKLMASNRKDVAKRYILYRDERNNFREKNSRINHEIAEKLAGLNVDNQNANVDERSFGGRIGSASSAVMKKFALDYCVSDMARENHLNNEVYIHDLDHYAVGDHNCTEGSAWVTIRDNGETKVIRVGDFADELGLADGQFADMSDARYQILSRDGWTKLRNITRRHLEPGEPLYEIRTRTGLPLKLTAHHRLPVMRNREEMLLEVKDICVGDELLSAEDVHLSREDVKFSFLDWAEIDGPDIDIRVANLSPLKSYLRFRYGVSFCEYIEKYCPHYGNHQPASLRLKDFLNLTERYPISYDVLSRLEISSWGSKHKYPLLIPYTGQLAKLYAYIYSDGSVYENPNESLYQINFSNTNEEIIDDFIDCFESCFGRKLNKWYPSDYYKENNSPCIRVYCGDKIIVKLFKQYAGGLMQGSGDLKIPDFIMSGTEDIQYSYLSAAIDCDGNLSSHNVQISTACRYYCEQLCLILQGLGYHPTIVAGDKRGSKYRFQKSNRTGVRNFDSYLLRIQRMDEMASLYDNMSTIKSQDGYAYRGISHSFSEHRIVSINVTSGEDISVYDMETSSHWFVLNNFISHNCLSVPFDKLLATGFNTRQTDVRPAQSVNTAFQLVAVIFQLQSLQQFGGVSATHLDWTMVPYVRKSFLKHYLDGLTWVDGLTEQDIEKEKAAHTPAESSPIDGDWNYKSSYNYAMEMTKKETSQAVEAMYHNLNTLQSRSGNQLNRKWLAA